MKNVIGMLVLVDSAALMKDYRLRELLSSKKTTDEIPLITWYDKSEYEKYIYMVADQRFVVNGQGTKDLTVKASPGDEIRWWEANIYSNSPFEIMIKEVSPPINSGIKWQAFYQHSPKLHSPLERETNSTIGLSQRDRFWAAAFSDFRYQTQIKEDTFLNDSLVDLDYHIDLQIISKSQTDEVPVCIFRWYPKIQLQEAS
ncbi:AidA/PixA family protein [Marinilabilia sp.]|jgi:hypothetical protein